MKTSQELLKIEILNKIELLKTIKDGPLSIEYWFVEDKELKPLLLKFAGLHFGLIGD